MNAHPLLLNLKLGGTEINLKHWVTGQYLSYRSFFKRQGHFKHLHMAWFQLLTDKAASPVFPLPWKWVPQSRVILRLSSSFLVLNRSTACFSDPNLIYWVLCSWAELSSSLYWVSGQQYTSILLLPCSLEDGLKTAFNTTWCWDG